MAARAALGLVAALACLSCVLAAEAAAAETAAGAKKGSGINCESGLIVPIWPGFEDMSLGDRFGRGLLYGILMIYLFIGVAIASDKFMESIEMITAQEKEVSVKDPRTGKTKVIIVKRSEEHTETPVTIRSRMPSSA